MTDDYRDNDTDIPPAPDLYGGDHDSPVPPQAPPENLPPWEDRANFTWLAGFLNTIPRAMTTPERFYANQPVRRGLWGPVSFGVLVMVIASMAEWTWARVFSDFDDMLYKLLGEDYAASGPEDMIMGLIESFGVLASPLIGLAMVFLVAGVVHLGVMLMASNGNRGFEATLRATAYAEAASILTLIPICGSSVGAVWTLVLAVIGVRAMHGIGTGPALIAVFGPLLLCCCGFGGLIALAGILSA